MSKLSKYERELRRVCHRVADELYVVGEFQKNNPHNIFRVCLPDYSVVRINLPSTPRNNHSALTAVGKAVRRNIMSNLQRRGLA